MQRSARGRIVHYFSINALLFEFAREVWHDREQTYGGDAIPSRRIKPKQRDSGSTDGTFTRWVLLTELNTGAVEINGQFWRDFHICIIEIQSTLQTIHLTSK